jgi:hypothetical protein
MSHVLFRYERVDPTTWAYLASLLAVALYFKFSRFWSVRNLDLLGLILFAPPLLLVKFGWNEPAANEYAKSVEHVGYIWLFVVSGLFMLRLLLDATMVRRPLLEPNLSVGGLAFLGVSLFVFLMANVIQGTPDRVDLSASERAGNLSARSAGNEDANSLSTHGPGFPLLFLLPHISTQTLLGDEAASETPLPAEPSALERTPTSIANEDAQSDVPAVEEGHKLRTTPFVNIVTARVVAILSQLAILIGVVYIGMRHFDNVKTGIAVAALYLLLPYTAMWTGNVTHSLPGALIVWAIAYYRRPLVAGTMIGLAFGTIYYPLFLLPLWVSFYWRRGLSRFLVGVLISLTLMVAVLTFTSTDTGMLLAHVRQMFGLHFPNHAQLNGAWQFWDPVYRYPLVAGFIGLSLRLALWPAQKNLGTLIAYSGAVMLGTQFWHAHSGGLALAWYLPLLLLTVFRPNLEDRVAIAVVRPTRMFSRSAEAT